MAAIDKGWFQLSEAIVGQQQQMLADDAEIEHAYAVGAMDEWTAKQNELARLDVEEAGGAES